MPNHAMSRTATALKDAELPAESTADSATASAPEIEHALGALDDARTGTLELIAELSDDDLERVHSSIMSPLVWDLGHIAAYEDLWLVQRLAGRAELLRGDLAELYDAFETPRAVRGEIEALGPAEARDYLTAVRARTVAALTGSGLGDGTIYEMVLRHELQHCETMRQTMAIADLLPAAEQAKRDQPLPPLLDGADQWIELPAGPFAMGADEQGFAYDNERPRHPVELDAFQIARRPVTNAEWMRFSEDGGYRRREWWSEASWAWNQKHDIAPHPQIAAGHAQAPVCHVSWFEADAFARAHGARLPNEAEWERAATWKQEQAPDRVEETPVTTGQAPQIPAGIGRVWEWTSSTFHGYPGFTAYPYREYSEVFFGEEYRVLRGGSWATHPRVATLTFRNWDLPLRRQIFAGLRLARDA
jgi:iron(II)-dependent oxidoreductase